MNQDAYILMQLIYKQPQTIYLELWLNTPIHCNSSIYFR